MNKEIAQLNRLLGERLGYANGTTPRFAWMWSPDVQYYYRQHVVAGWQRHCWADRIGKCWVLCQWRPPAMPECEWWTTFHGEFPYPRKGMYYALPETRTMFGEVPTTEMTVWYVRVLDAQISKSYAEHKAEIDEQIAKDEAHRDAEWVAMVQDSNPAFSSERLTAGQHGANFEFMS